MLYLLALVAGASAGLRSLSAPALVSWGAFAGWVAVEGTALSFMASPITAGLLTFLALGELIVDKLPSTPSRKAPPGFIARLISGALCGATLGAAGGVMVAGAAVGLVGAALGTLGGYRGRMALAGAWGRDLPAAIVEDAVAIGAVVLVLLSLR